MRGQLSKEEALKRYLNNDSSKSRRNKDEGTVKYITGELPDNIESFDVDKNVRDFYRSSEDAPTIVRKVPASYLKRNYEEDAELKAKYDLWGKGVKNVELKHQRLEDERALAAKPLARHRDDEDYNKLLREKEIETDPMASYFKKKRDKNRPHDPEDELRNKVLFNGVEPPPNRFNIMPGFRWDGVDRGNGFERKIIEERQKKQHRKQVAEQWAQMDM